MLHSGARPTWPVSTSERNNLQLRSFCCGCRVDILLLVLGLFLRTWDAIAVPC